MTWLIQQRANHSHIHTSSGWRRQPYWRQWMVQCHSDGPPTLRSLENLLCLLSHSPILFECVPPTQPSIGAFFLIFPWMNFSTWCNTLVLVWELKHKDEQRQHSIKSHPVIDVDTKLAAWISQRVVGTSHLKADMRLITDAAFSPRDWIRGVPCRKTCFLKKPRIKARGIEGRIGGLASQKKLFKDTEKTMEVACVLTDRFQPQSFQPTPFSLLVLLLEESKSQVNVIRHL